MGRCIARLIAAAMLLIGTGTGQQHSRSEDGQASRPVLKPYSALVAGVSPGIAPGAAASLFGDNLATGVAIAAPPYPTILGGVTLQINDSAGVAHSAHLLYVSPKQINYIVPVSTPVGPATIQTAGMSSVSASVHVDAVLPALFTADADGKGVVAATAERRLSPGGPTFLIPVFQCAAPGNCTSVPLDPGLDAPVTVTLYATGIHNRPRDSNVTLTIGGTQVPVTSVTSYNEDSPMAGIDQVVFPLVLTLRGKGEVDVVLTVDGVASNAGRINIQ